MALSSGHRSVTNPGGMEMSLVTPTVVLSHWNKLFEGLQQSADEFYREAEKNIGTHHLSDVKTERVKLSEGGVFSANREYLQVRRKEHVYHVCAAPYGTGFFVSSWLGEKEGGFWAWACGLPYIGVFFRLIHSVAKPLTYYRIDNAEMFHALVHGAVTRALDTVLEASGQKPLTELDRKPIMRDLFERL